MKPAMLGRFSSLILAGGACLLSLSLPAAENNAPGTEIGSPAAPDFVSAAKISGDNALKEQSYDVAASFYRAYRKEAEKNGNPERVREAFACEIDALILGARSAQAAEVLKAYRTRFAQTDPVSQDLWNADIFLLQRNADAAQKILTKLLPSITEKDPRRIHALTALAAVYELKKDYAKAFDAYTKLSELAGNTPLGRRVEERRIMVLAASGDQKNAIEVLAKLKLNEDERSIEAYRLLNTYILLKSNALNTIPEDFMPAQISDSMRTDSFFYAITSLIADEFSVRGDKTSAVTAYGAAYLYARTPEEAVDALNRMTKCLAGMDRKEDAAVLAERQLALFYKPDVPQNVKLFAADLFASTERDQKALDLYLRILETQAPQGRRPLLNTVFNQLMRLKKYDLAENLSVQYFQKYEPKANPAPRLILQGRAEEGKGNVAVAAKFYHDAMLADASVRKHAGFHAAELYYKMADYKNVIAVADKVLAGGNDPVLFFRAASHLALKNTGSALRDYLAYEKLPSDQAKDAMKAQAVFNAALIHYREQRYAEAQKLFERIFQTYPKEELAPAAGYQMILCSYAMEKEQLAETQTLDLVKKYPGSEYSGNAMLKLAEYYVDFGLLGKAENLLDKVVEQVENETIKAQAYYQKALLAFHRKDLEQAEKTVGFILEHFSKTASLAEIYFLQGDIYRTRGQFAEAAEAYRKSAAFRPGSRQAQAAIGSEGDMLFAMASKADNTQGFHDALAIYEKLLEQEDLLTEFAIMTRYKAGRCHQLLGESKQAAAEYKLLLFGNAPAQYKDRPSERFWLLKGMNAFELLALKSADIESINDAIKAMTLFQNSGIAPEENYRKRINVLKKLKRQIITSGDQNK